MIKPKLERQQVGAPIPSNTVQMPNTHLMMNPQLMQQPRHILQQRGNVSTTSSSGNAPNLKLPSNPLTNGPAVLLNNIRTQPSNISDNHSEKGQQSANNSMPIRQGQVFNSMKVNSFKQQSMQV
jgi:hypothetical protein